MGSFFYGGCDAPSGASMKILPGTASRRLATSLSKEMSAPVVSAEIKRFPDSECYARLLDDVKGEDVVVVQNTYPDDNLVEHLILQDAARLSGAGRVFSVIPYFGYARQDKQFKPGEPVTARLMARTAEANADGTILIDIHNLSTLEEYRKKAVNASAVPSLARFLSETEKIDVVLSPDKGSLGRAGEAARLMKCRFDHLEKTRIDGSTVTIKPKELDVAGLNVAIVDDIIATGGTIAASAEQLKKRGAKRIVAACTHGLYTGGGLARLRGVCDAVYSSDTLENESTSYSPAREVAAALKSISI
jgi:ribose-phosphate pyrophosphokinase